MLKRQRGNLFQATHHREGRAGEAKASRKNKQPALASTPPSFGRSKRKQRGPGEAYAQGGRPASRGWGTITLLALPSHRPRDGCTAHSCFHHRKTRERHFMSLSPKQVQVMNIRRKIWAGSRLLFSSLSSLSPAELNRLEDAGEEEGSGHLKAPIQLPR